MFIFNLFFSIFFLILFQQKIIDRSHIKQDVLEFFVMYDNFMQESYTDHQERQHTPAHTILTDRHVAPEGGRGAEGQRGMPSPLTFSRSNKFFEIYI